MTVTVQGLYNEYNGNYSVIITLPILTAEDNFNFLNNEPIFTNENGTKCIWKENNDKWWIGRCDEVGLSKGLAYMNNCTCPWPR